MLKQLWKSRAAKCLENHNFPNSLQNRTTFGSDLLRYNPESLPKALFSFSHSLIQPFPLSSDLLIIYHTGKSTEVQSSCRVAAHFRTNHHILLTARLNPHPSIAMHCHPMESNNPHLTTNRHPSTNHPKFGTKESQREILLRYQGHVEHTKSCTNSVGGLFRYIQPLSVHLGSMSSHPKRSIRMRRLILVEIFQHCSSSSYPCWLVLTKKKHRFSNDSNLLNNSFQHQNPLCTP